jgi:transposase
LASPFLDAKSLRRRAVLEGRGCAGLVEVIGRDRRCRLTGVVAFSPASAPLPTSSAANTREFKLEAVRLIKDRGVSYIQASQDLDVHVSQLRDWVKKFSDDPQQAFPGHGQMKPEQLEIERLKRQIAILASSRMHYAPSIGST